MTESDFKLSGDAFRCHGYFGWRVGDSVHACANGSIWSGLNGCCLGGSKEHTYMRRTDSIMQVSSSRKCQRSPPPGWAGLDEVINSNQGNFSQDGILLYRGGGGGGGVSPGPLTALSPSTLPV